ncbi:prephenate dehydrogenase [Phorcysia thermohydrogeniphila]|uniref:prephenate dehydrogenase n=1 Tax=Phorcysia thermohydrogeniphila TaxID=936138 RepID=A0A4R1G637_9BACT|nr:prephenate dehydrogenase/arogenate dehydrogenase family protein [Phorcysia thermohydrogeniphila]TCK03437.1 prephenate dehydrogenase [Phorcysia thermohydrogeniphila]
MEWNFKEICIVGLGLIGGSFALNLKLRGFPGKITAVDINPEAIEKGIELEVIDSGSIKHSIAESADLIVLSTPVGVYEEVLKQIKPFISNRAIVSDLGSVKGHLVYRCEEILKGIAPFVGGHPIAGTEKSGVENVVENLFEGAKFIITPTENTDREAMEKIANLWRNLGSEIVVMDPYHHDRVFAAVSHLPHVVAYSIVDAIDKLSKELSTNLFQLTGGGFRDFTRIAMSDPVMWRDICIENRENLLSALKTFRESIEKVEKLIEKSDGNGLKSFFEKAREKRRSVK